MWLFLLLHHRSLTLHCLSKCSPVKLLPWNHAFSFICIQRPTEEAHSSSIASLYFSVYPMSFFPQKGSLGCFLLLPSFSQSHHASFPNSCHMPVQCNKVGHRFLPGFLILIHGGICFPHIQVKCFAEIHSVIRINSPGLWDTTAKGKIKAQLLLDLNCS